MQSVPVCTWQFDRRNDTCHLAVSSEALTDGTNVYKGRVPKHVGRCAACVHVAASCGYFNAVMGCLWWYIRHLPVVQSQISKQDGQIKNLQAERTSLAAQLEDMRANLQSATSLADQQVSSCVACFIAPSPAVLWCFAWTPHTCLPACCVKPVNTFLTLMITLSAAQKLPVP